MRRACIALAACALLLAGCERTFRDMYDQPRYKPLAASPLWPDGRASRPPADGTLAAAEGTFAGSASGRRGRVEAPPAVSPLEAIRPELRPSDVTAAGGDTSGRPGATLTLPPITAPLLARGRERFDVYCSPCHSVVGDGDGLVARRGFPAPPSYHTDRLRNASDAHFYAVMTYGYGAMYPYADRLTPADRLAVIAYIRALQLSQHAPLDAVPAPERAALEARR
jgi:mono/diheme cytochrome c family protein